MDLKDAMCHDPIVGVEQVVETEHGPGAREALALPSPPTVTPAQGAAHCLTNLPFHPGCPICVACRRPNTHHRQAHESERVIPLLVADYCYVKATGGETLQTMLVMRVYPYKRFFACLTPHKGAYPPLTKRIAQCLKDTGPIQFAYRCDGESAIDTSLDAASLDSARKGVRVHPDEFRQPFDPNDCAEHVVDEDEPDAPTEMLKQTSGHGPVVANPELAHPGGTPSNGLAKRAVQAIEDHSRTILAALEARIKVPIPADHAIVAWGVEHTAYVLNKDQVGPDGRTAFGRQHGTATRERVREFGERILWYVPKRIRSELDQTWRHGFLGGARLRATKT